jgi:hypothetical protein
MSSVYLYAFVVCFAFGWIWDVRIGKRRLKINP